MNNSRSYTYRKEELEIAVGTTLLFTSWLIIFLVVIEVIEPPSPELMILVSFLCYIASVVGLALASHGLVVRIIEKKRKQAQYSSR